MAYQSLYRKYRSRDFGDLIGQRHITQTLANAIASERVTHAYLFCGPRGTGKTSTARVLAKALNCVHGPTAAPCDVCPNCQSIRQGSAMDVIEIDAASNRNIDDMRQLREQVNYPPVELRYKFYIVDEVHQLTRDAFNAFLKTLEEPPPHVIFVLCTTDPHQLPATILSRCQRFDFHRITQDDIVDRLRWVVQQEGWTVEDEALFLLARSANGGMRDALSLLDQTASYAGSAITAQHVRDILGGIDLDLLLEFSQQLLSKDASGLFHLVDRIMSEGKDVPQLFSELIQHWRNLLRVLIGGPEQLLEFTAEQRKSLAQQAAMSHQSAVMRAITLLCEGENELRWNGQQRLLLELYSLRIMQQDEAPLAVAQAAPMRQEPVRQAARPAAAVPAPAPASAPAPAPVSAPAVEEPAPPASSGEMSLARLKHEWRAFIEWMSRNEKLNTLRTRIVEQAWPATLSGTVLTLGTTSAFVREQVKDRPQVKQTLEQCLSRYYKANLVVQVEMQDAAPAPVAPAAAAPVPRAPATPPVPPPAAPEPPRDTIGDRMKQVFPDSEEI